MASTKGTTILLVEQNAYGALEIAYFGYVLGSGLQHHFRTSKEIAADARVREAYLGV